MKRLADKDPADSKDYWIDWTNVLASLETVSTATWTIPAGLTEDVSLTRLEGNISYVGLTGGTPGTAYVVTCKIVTSVPRTFEKSIQVWCREL